MVERSSRDPQKLHHEDEIISLNRDLRMAEVFLYFIQGHTDKTEEMLDEAL